MILYNLFPSYKEIFPSEEEPTFEDLIKNVSTLELLKLLSEININIYLHSHETRVHEKIFSEICNNINRKYRREITTNYNNFKTSNAASKPNVIIFLSVNILDVMIATFKYSNNHIHKKSDQELLSLTAIKCILLANTLHNRKMEHFGYINNISNFAVSAAQYSFNRPRNPFYLINLSSELFSFLENSKDLSPYVSEFLEKLNLKDHKEYINIIMNLQTEPIVSNNYIIKLGKSFEPYLKDSLDFLSTDISKNVFPKLPSGYDRDYRLIREKPLVKIGNNQYCILDINLLSDKMYIGLIFNIYNNTSLKTRKNLFGSFSDFLNHLGQEFAEKQIFHKIIPTLFVNDKPSVMTAGNEYTNEEYSDYYIRNDQDIYLFEYKNYLINADIKSSFNYGKIHEEIYKKMVEKIDDSGKTKPKGVTQFINSIEKINKKGFAFDPLDLKDKKKLNIYPILVYSDEFFNIHGMHDLLNKNFFIRLNNKIRKSHNIKDIILISLEDLIKVSYTVNKDNMSFQELVRSYFIKEKNLPRTENYKYTTYTKPHFAVVMRDELLELSPEDGDAFSRDILGEDPTSLTGIYFDNL